ncbi:MAG: shikimate dehydrogenase, partial [Phycisphaera sp.]|nr:shikimate dehydrogenase [Phycisphaera sp.]
GLDFSGCSVTHPHKENLVRLVRELGGEIDEASDRINAANTLIVDESRRVRCLNTDVDAAVAAFAAGSGRESSALRGMRVAVFGAGGVARATVYGLIRAGADVTVFNRTRDRGEALVEDLQQWGSVVFAGGFDAFEASEFAGLVNCTSLGMLGGPHAEEACIADATSLPEAFIVMDTVYAPRRTPLLQIAESQGAVV